MEPRLKIYKSLFTPGISIVIPCLNESETIARAVDEALEGIRQSGHPGEVIVADNGSTDPSRKIAGAHGAKVVPVAVRGYGAAVNAGILAANYSCVIFGDADMSYPFLEAKALAEPILSGKAEFVLGSRLQGTIAQGAMPLLNRYLGTPVLSFLIRFFFKIPTSDCNSGMRAIFRERYEELMLHCPGMEYASEMLIRVSQHGLTYLETPISFRKDQRSRPPHLRRWQDGWRHLRFILGNAPDGAVIGLPIIVASALMGISFLLSYQNYFAPHAPFHYHTAFMCLALAVPPLMSALSFLLIKVALHQSRRARSAFMGKVQEWSEKSRPIQFALGALALTLIQTALIFWSWRAAHWGDIAEIGGMIRIMLFTIVSAAAFALDMGIGLLKILPFEAALIGRAEASKTELPPHHKAVS